MPVAVFASYTDPNARCPVCGDSVFFYQSPHGGRVFFDELGPPWPKHPCTDRPRTRVALIAASYPGQTGGAVRQSAPAWKVEGWIAIDISTSVRKNGTHEVHCVDRSGGTPRELTVFADEAVQLSGAAAAAMQPWDEGGRSVMSYVDLGAGSTPREVRISRSAPNQHRQIVNELTKAVTAAEAEAETVEVSAVVRRYDQLERTMAVWSQHLSDEDSEIYWERFRAARARALVRVETVTAAKSAARHRMLAEARDLMTWPDWEAATKRFRALEQDWRKIDRGLTTDVALTNAFLAVQRALAAKAKQEKAKRARAARIEAKKRLLKEARDLCAASDWATADARFRSLAGQWKALGHFNEAGERDLSEQFRTADQEFRTARAQALAEAARKLDARTRKQRAATRQDLISEVEVLSTVSNWEVAARRFRDVHRRWQAVGHLSDDGAPAQLAAFEVAIAAYAAAHAPAIEDAARRKEEQAVRARSEECDRILKEAEALALSPVWNPDAFQALVSRWDGAGLPRGGASWRRLQDALLIGRGGPKKNDIRRRLELTAQVEQLAQVDDLVQLAMRYVDIRRQWTSLPRIGADIEKLLGNRFESAVVQSLRSCDPVKVKAAVAAHETERLHALGGTREDGRANDFEARLEALRALAASLS